MTVYACIIIHVFERTVIFFGQLDSDSKAQLSEEIISKLFLECENLLIGQNKFLNIDGEKFSASNLEDIVVSLHVRDVDKNEEKKYLNLATYIGKSFKHQYQSEIDELDGATADINTVFGGFGSILGGILKKFLDEDMNAMLSSSDVQVSEEEKVSEERKVINANKAQTPARFPGGTIPEVERDEVLFQEYQEISQMYNVEMIDGLVSKNKIYVYSNVDQYHEFEIDFTNYPEKPLIKLPRELDDILSLSQSYNNWDKQDPPRIVDLVADLEQVLGQQQAPTIANALSSNDEVDYVGEKNLRKEEEEKKAASNLLAQRLLSKDTSSDSRALEEITEVQLESIEIKEPQPVIYEIIETTEAPLNKTPLSQLIEKEKTAPVIEKTEPEPSEGIIADPEPTTFKIKPKFHFPGEDTIKESPVKTSVSETPIPTEQEVETRTPEPVDLNVLEQKASTPARKGLDVKKSFVIPGFDELEDYSPIVNVKKPALQMKPVLATPRQSKPPSTQAARSPAASQPMKPKPKPKDDDVMFEWGDDSDEMQITTKREIKDFDFEIKKVDSGKKDNA
ncbi:MAG: hypothetical protein ACFFCS_19420 [Candidatus Hodarchaeota archaeon]